MEISVDKKMFKMYLGLLHRECAQCTSFRSGNRDKRVSLATSVYIFKIMLDTFLGATFLEFEEYAA